MVDDNDSNWREDDPSDSEEEEEEESTPPGGDEEDGAEERDRSPGRREYPGSGRRKSRGPDDRSGDESEDSDPSSAEDDSEDDRGTDRGAPGRTVGGEASDEADDDRDREESSDGDESETSRSAADEESGDRRRADDGEASDAWESALSENEEDVEDAKNESVPKPSPGTASGERGDETGETDDAADAPAEVAEERTSEPKGEDVEREALEGEKVLPIRREYVEDLLIELGEIAGERGFDSLRDEVHEDRIPALREGRMSVVVLGEFNHGKSTVVNALLGEEILPTGITPTTSEITHLVYDDEPTVTLQPAGDGETREIDYDELGGAVTDEEDEDENDEDEDLEYVEIGYPNDLLEDSLVLVDTPGVNDISRQKVEITYGYVPRADVILYVLDATQILKKSEITFIEDKLLEANRDRIIFVLGKVDALSDEEAREVEQYARERLESILGEPVDLYPFSGREAIEAIERGEEPTEAFQEFKTDLLQFLREEKAEIIIDSALGGGLRVASMLEQNLAIERQAYRLKKEELEERIEAVREKLEESQQLIAENLDLIDERIGGIAATARHNLHNFRDEFLETLPRQIEQAEARDVQLYLSAWIQDQFKEWLETEGTEIAESLEELAEEVIEVTNESIQETVEAFREEFGLRDQLDLEVDTIAYDMSVFALGGVGLSVLFLANTLVGGLLTAATPVLAMFFKGRVDEKIKERAREEGRQAIREASDAVEEELMDVIYEYGDRLEEFVETAGDRLYRQVQEALAQVQRERSREDREKVLAEVDERVERVRRVAELLRSSREKLRSHDDESAES